MASNKTMTMTPAQEADITSGDDSRADRAASVIRARARELADRLGTCVEVQYATDGVVWAVVEQLRDVEAS